ncbi:YqzE family protein [Bacillus suaedae]|uniref:YqzE family protein n=1 Tax=Halalkalibacter suaedae TaxID=2822140 RepID=A0A940WT96_9BACI|nr:YqzE family protein [Bacillus suaedae]MBP3952339.1 YqzE family protein [Bacillus suaedae]
MSLNDYVKFLTQQAVRRMDQPRELRRSEKEERKANRLPYSSHMFGMIPLAFSVLIKRHRNKK